MESGSRGLSRGIRESDGKMTALELADAMDRNGFRYLHVRKAVVMLREQAQIIENQGKILKAYAEALEKCGLKDYSIIQEALLNRPPLD